MQVGKPRIMSYQSRSSVAYTNHCKPVSMSQGVWSMTATSSDWTTVPVPDNHTVAGKSTEVDMTLKWHEHLQRPRI